jgi:hypothetical protein
MFVLEVASRVGRQFQGDLRRLTLPRAKALGYSVSPFHGAFRYDFVEQILATIVGFNNSVLSVSLW